MLPNVINTVPAIMAVVLFVLAYCLVIAEEFIQLRKSKPMVVAAGIIWVIVAYLAKEQGMMPVFEQAVRKNILEFSELFLFIVVAVTYINAMEDRNVFEVIRAKLTKMGLSYRQLFWMTGILAFFISAIADNLTTTIAMSAVILAVGKKSPRFVSLGCINLVVAANAGGAFSPFGDITTLMVWQANIVPFQDFFQLFLPSVINFLVPALCMHFALPKTKPEPLSDSPQLEYGAITVVLLFLLTIATTVLLHHYFELPPAVGMMLGLGYLQFFAYYTDKSKNAELIDIFPIMQRVEWDTLLFFYGVILCVGALGTLGYLELISSKLYSEWNSSLINLSPAYQQAPANIIIGLLSALIDNIPVMFAVLTMKPTMSEGQWLLVTLTTGVGGSLLSVGSAAGVALMGQAKGVYTFLSHLKWIWAIALGYFLSILFHLWWNAHLF